MRQRCVNNPYQITTVFGNVPGYPLNNGFHTGTDYVSTDKYIVAPMNSKIVQKGYDATNGNYLVLETNGYRDWFSHIDRYLVTGGDVKIGQALAVMGATGAASGVHVHHSLRVNGELVDPEKHIGGQVYISEEEYKDLQAWKAKGIDAQPYKDSVVKSKAWTTDMKSSVNNVTPVINDLYQFKKDNAGIYSPVQEQLYKKG